MKGVARILLSLGLRMIERWKSGVAPYDTAGKRVYCEEEDIVI